MTLEEIRECFAAARDLVKIGDSSNVNTVISDIEKISEHIKQIYQTASIFDKVKCKLQYEYFDNIISLLKINGIEDHRVLAFFGLDPSEVGKANISDIVSGDGVETKHLDADQPKAPDAAHEKSKEERAADASPDKTHASAEPYKREHPDTVNPVQNGTAPMPKIPMSDSADKPAFEPQSLRDFIGQEHIVKALLKEIAIAKAEGRKHLDNILFFGNSGLGKSTLMKLVAKELLDNEDSYVLLDCTQFGDNQKSKSRLQGFFETIAKNNKPIVIAFDEVHMLSDNLQSILLNLLNDRAYVTPLSAKESGKEYIPNERIPIPDFTFIAATTDYNKVLETIKNRCLRLTFRLVDYTYDELKRIYQNKIAAKGLTAEDDVIDACIPRSRRAIRYVNSIVDGLNSALYNDNGERISTHIDLDVATAYFKEKGIDPMGLEAKDLEILQVLRENVGEYMGAEVLAARVGLDVKVYLSEHEKYLIKIGFINVLNKGRALTEAAIKYLDGNDGDEKEKVGGSEESPSPDNSLPDSAHEKVQPGDRVDNGGERDCKNDDADHVAPKDIIDDLFGN